MPSMLVTLYPCNFFSLPVDRGSSDSSLTIITPIFPTRRPKLPLPFLRVPHSNTQGNDTSRWRHHSNSQMGCVSDSQATYKTSPGSRSRWRSTCSFGGPRPLNRCRFRGGTSTGQPVYNLPCRFCLCYDGSPVFPTQMAQSTSSI